MVISHTQSTIQRYLVTTWSDQRGLPLPLKPLGHNSKLDMCEDRKESPNPFDEPPSPYPVDSFKQSFKFWERALPGPGRSQNLKLPMLKDINTQS